MLILGGRLSNDDGGGKEKDKKAIALDLQNKNFARARTLFCTFPCLFCMITT